MKSNPPASSSSSWRLNNERQWVSGAEGREEGENGQGVGAGASENHGLEGRRTVGESALESQQEGGGGDIPANKCE